jgi:hypothetical protein
MVHTYRNRKRNRRLLSKVGGGFFWGAVGLFFVATFFAGSPLTLLVSVPLFLVWVGPIYADFFRRYYEIRFSDEGACEFKAALRTKRLRAQQIISVQRNDRSPFRWNTDPAEFTVLRFQEERLVLVHPIDDFEGFLARLEALNPAVQVRDTKAKVPEPQHA